MKSHLWTIAFLLLSSTPSIANPQFKPEVELVARDANANANAHAEVKTDLTCCPRQKEEHDLFKRKGGGGGGGKGGGGSSSGGKGGKGGSSSSSRYANGDFHISGSLTDGQNGVGKRDVGREESGEGIARDEDGISLSRRKYGGFGGGRGGYWGGSGKASSSNSKKSSSSSGGKGGVTSSSSSAGGRTKSGSGPAPAYGGGRYYGGGAATPYSAGARSPLGIAPLFLGVALLSIYPGLWLYGAYIYPYHNPYTFRNHSATANGTNTTTNVVETRQASDTTGVIQTLPVTCLCAAYSVCGCDDNGNSTFLDQLIGDGNYAALNKSVINVADVNGTTTIILNGTLPNGTTASGGTDSAAARTIAEGLGLSVLITIVFATCFVI
ncbi:hypothetical protein NHQ30_003460 [Ciborinia camelliae]|nr:hypothetical protein NHQ30_003460 [Ciborinia camelliae]